MEEAQLMQEGLNLMVIGTGFVIVFLALLVIVMTLIAKVVMRFAVAPDM